MGRRKIEIQPLTDDRNRTVTFVKRKAGLFKKAHELAVLCQVDLAVVIVGSNNKVYEFSSVDTNELMKHYQKNLASNIRPQEQKSPENYGNYKKKSFLHEKLTKKASTYLDDPEEDDDGESEYDSDSPEPKRAKRSYSDVKKRPSPKINVPKAPPPPRHISMTNMPTFNQPNYRSNIKSEDPGSSHLSGASNKAHKRDDSISSNNSQSLRPVLRVQIPSDSKGPKNKSGIADSARTISAIDTTLQSSSNGGQSSVRHTDNSATTELSMHSIMSRNTSGGSAANEQEPHNVLSQTHLHPHTASSIPPITARSNYSSFASPDGTRKPTLPLIIQTKSATVSPASATAPQLPLSANNTNMNNMFYTSLPQNSPSSAYPGVLPTPILNQVYNPSNPNDQGNQNNRNPKFRSPPVSNQQQQHQQQQQGVLQYQQANTNNPGSNVIGEQTPTSGLPSRYVNDMFPSPSNFYAPQDWPNPPGMTPIQSSYFMGMLPSAGPNGPSTGQLFEQASRKAANQNRPNTRNETLPSPLHFMSNASFSNANNNITSNTSNPSNPNANSDNSKK